VRRRYVSFLGFIGLTVGCLQDPRSDEVSIGNPGETAGAGSATSDGSGTSDGSSTTGVDASSSSSDGGLKLDVAAAETESGGDEAGCSKVDFLFVIDNSGSMALEQDQLIASFGPFMDTIRDTLGAAQDYHVMVVDTDAWVFGGCSDICDELAPCLDDNGQCVSNDPVCIESCLSGFPFCADYDCADPVAPETCEDVLGAGVTHPKGAGASGQDCNFTSNARYIDATEPDLDAAFSCAASVGNGSTVTPERPVEALINAITAGTDAAACNEGFLRDDAILVVTLITDEDDDEGDGSAGSVQTWKPQIVDAKNGDETAVVVLGLFGDGDLAVSQCDDFSELSNNGAEPSPRLREFVESWGDRGLRGSVCAPNYGPFFEGAVGLIDNTCDNFEPPG